MPSLPARARAALTALILLSVTTTAQTLLSPVVIAHHNNGGGDLTHQPPPQWRLDLGYEPYMRRHPVQFSPTGSGRSDLHTVSIIGDLSHGSGARYVLDWRARASGYAELIVQAATAGSEANPSWWYDGTGGQDDATDRVLLDNAAYTVQRARWSTDGNRIAFEGLHLASGLPGIFVGDVVRDGSGFPTSLSNLTLAALNGREPSWGNGSRFAFVRDGVGSFVADVSIPSAPVEFPLPVWAQGLPSLAHDGNRAAYGKVIGSRREIVIYNLGSGVETQITTPQRHGAGAPLDPQWSPNDADLVFWSSDNNPVGCSTCSSVFKVAVSGTKKSTKLAGAYVTNPPNQQNNVIVGSLGYPRWRG